MEYNYIINFVSHGWGRRTISHVTARSRTFIIYTYVLGVSGFLQVSVIIMSSETLSDYPGRESEFAKSLYEKKKNKTNRFQTITVIQAYFKPYKSDKWCRGYAKTMTVISARWYNVTKYQWRKNIPV